MNHQYAIVFIGTRRHNPLRLASGNFQRHYRDGGINERLHHIGSQALRSQARRWLHGSQLLLVCTRKKRRVNCL